jgi:hypothetical protein
MMEIISERHAESITCYQLCYEYAPNCGYGFPCDEHGNVLTDDPNYECWKDNYNDCVNGRNPHLTDVRIRKQTHKWMENAKGICTHCGREVELHNEYCGACQCECGQWYNMFGQEINPPSMWEEPIEPEDYY